jgi:hypothetical protein
MQEILLFLNEKGGVKIEAATCNEQADNKCNAAVELPGAIVFVYPENWRSKANFFFIIATFVYITSGYSVT